MIVDPSTPFSVNAVAAGWKAPSYESIQRSTSYVSHDTGGFSTVIRDDLKLGQLVRARDCQSQGRRFNSGKNPKWKPENSNLHRLDLHRPLRKGTKLLIQVIKTIINQTRSVGKFSGSFYVCSRRHDYRSSSWPLNFFSFCPGWRIPSLITRWWVSKGSKVTSLVDVAFITS